MGDHLFPLVKLWLSRCFPLSILSLTSYFLSFTLCVTNSFPPSTSFSQKKHSSPLEALSFLFSFIMVAVQANYISCFHQSIPSQLLPTLPRTLNSFLPYSIGKEEVSSMQLALQNSCNVETTSDNMISRSLQS